MIGGYRSDDDNSAGSPTNSRRQNDLRRLNDHENGRYFRFLNVVFVFRNVPWNFSLLSFRARFPLSPRARDYSCTYGCRLRAPVVVDALHKLHKRIQMICARDGPDGRTARRRRGETRRKKRKKPQNLGGNSE